MLPFIHVFGRPIPSYGLMMAAAFLLSGFLSCLRAHRAGKSWEDLLVILACALGLGLVGGGTLYILVTYSPAQIAAMFRQGQWQRLFAGGMVFYGGLLGGIAGAFLGARIVRVRVIAYLPSLVPTLPLAHALGRVGCFLAGCCYGRPTDLPIGIVYSSPYASAPLGVSLFPVQLLESALNLLLFFFLLWYTRKQRPAWAPLFVYLLCYAVMRFLLEYLRYDEIRGIALGLSTSQWISLGLFLFALIGLARQSFPSRRGA